MKLKKSAVASIVIAILFGGISAMAMAEENNTETQDVNVLKSKIGELEKTVNAQAEQIQQTGKILEELRKQLTVQIEENNRLRELCKKAGIVTTKESGSASKPIGRIIYRGKERDEDWFNRMYERFSDKIALAGDKFVDPETFKLKSISDDYVEVGTIIDAGYGENKVVSVIGDKEALIHYQYVPQMTLGGMRVSSTNIIYHLCGYDHPLIDGQTLGIKNLICVGTYKYTTASGVQKTVQSFKMCEWKLKPLTREQFAEALRSGFELVNYVEKQGKTVKVPIR